MMKTIVIGLGNPILTDDGVGVKVAYAVDKTLKISSGPDITVTEASVGGLRLMELLVGYDRAIIIDAITTRNGEPGRVHRLTLEDLEAISPTQHSASAHDTTLVTALKTGNLMGLTLPNEIVIYAVEVENVIDFSEESTPAVTESIPLVTSLVLDELNRIKY
jgi:hydrogenase maturation protease